MPTPTRLGSEFQVNNFHPGDQGAVSITTMSDGRFVAVWSSSDAPDDFSAYDVKGRIFLADGTPDGAEFAINQNGSGHQSQASVAALADGGFAVTWEDWSGPYKAVKARMFDADGGAVTNDLAISYGADDHTRPAIATLNNGNVVVTWQNGTAAPGWPDASIKAAILSPAGGVVVAPFDVPGVTSTKQKPVVAALSEGGFAIAWAEDITNPVTSAITSQVGARVFDASGIPTGSLFSTVTDWSDVGLFSRSVSISAKDEDQFVISFADNISDEDYLHGVATKAFVISSPDAIAYEADFFNANADQRERYSATAFLPDDRLVVVWMDFESDPDVPTIRGQVFHANNGSRDGAEFTCNFTTEGTQGYPSVTALADGKFVVAWEDDSGVEDPSAYGVRAQVFDASGTPPENTAPVSDLFDIGLVTVGEAVSVYMGFYFSDADDDTLTYTFSGLPAGVRSDEFAGWLTGTITAPSGDYRVFVTADDGRGGTVTDSFVWEVRTAPRVVGKIEMSSTGGWTTGADGKVRAIGQVTFKHVDGDNLPLFTVKAGAVVIDGNSIAVSGKIWAPVDAGPQAPLFKGKFTIASDTLAVTSFADEKITDDFALWNDRLELNFTGLSLRKDKIVLATDLAVNADALPPGLPFLAALHTSNSPLALHVDNYDTWFGPRVLGTGRWLEKPLEFKLPGLPGTKLEFSDASLEYDFVQDAVYLGGKAKVSWGGGLGSQLTLFDVKRAFEVDLAGDIDPLQPFEHGTRYIKMFRTAEGWDYDIVGKFSYKASATPGLPGPVVREISLGLNTETNSLSGKMKLAPAWMKGAEFTGELGFVFDNDGAFDFRAIKFDSFLAEVDRLNKPIAATGLFFQGGSLSFSDWAGTSETELPTFKLAGNVSLGPKLAGGEGFGNGEVSLTIAGPLAQSTITGTISFDFTPASILPGTVVSDLRAGRDTDNAFVRTMKNWFRVDVDDILEFSVIEYSGSLVVNKLTDSTKVQAQVEFMEGLFARQTTVQIAKNGDHDSLLVQTQGEFAAPDRLAVIGGTAVEAHIGLWLTTDNDVSDDFFEFWSEIDINLTRFIDFDSSIGMRIYLDGNVDILGMRDVPMLTGAGAAHATGGGGVVDGFSLRNSQELVILSATWDTAKTGVKLVLITPDGERINEADFADHPGISLISKFTTTTSRHIGLLAPETGVWQVEVVDDSGLGTVDYAAKVMLEGASGDIAGVTLNQNGTSATLRYDMEQGDARNAVFDVFASKSATDLAGIRINSKDLLLDPETQSLTWNFDGFAPGTYHLFIRAAGDNAAPTFTRFDQTFRVKAADEAWQLRGSAAGETLAGTAVADAIYGKGGGDNLIGRYGKDQLFGGLGGDSLLGGNGADVLRGNAGQDDLRGGAGADRLLGGLGADQFTFANGDGRDRIEDFNLASDRLRLSDDLWQGSKTAAQVLARFAKVTADGVVLTFGDGDGITLMDVRSLARLEAAVDLF